MDHPFRGLGPFFVLIPPYYLGIFASLASGPAWPGAALLFLGAALGSAALSARPTQVAAAAMALCGALAAGRVGLVDPEQALPLLAGEAMLRGTATEVRAADGGWSGTAADAVVAAVGGGPRIRLPRVLLSVRNSDAAFPVPAEVRAFGRIRPLRSRGNPGEIPREWRGMAAGAQYVFETEGDRMVVLPAPPSAAGIFGRARERTVRWIERHAGRSDGALFLAALATGAVPPPSHPLCVLLRKTGLAHLLAISGLNVAIFFSAHAAICRSLLWAFLRHRGAPDLNRFSAFLSLPVCWAYVLMAGHPPSAVRSAGMITAAVLLRYGAGIASAGFCWALLFLGTLVVSPFGIFSPGMLLSYGAAFFLIVEFAGRKRPDPSGRPRLRILGRLRDAAVASTTPFFGTLPVAAAFFGAFPAGSVLWNLLFGPILGGAGVAGAFVAAAGAAFGLDFLGPPVALAARALSAALALLSRVSGDGSGEIPLPPAGIVAPAVCVAAAAAGAVAMRRRGKATWPAPLAAAAVFLGWIHLPYAALPRDRLLVTALNAGRGAAHVIAFPGGAHAVIDCGSGTGGRAGVVVPFLRRQGVRRIDLLVLSHPHEDHYGGAAALLDAFPVGEIWIPAGSRPEEFGPAVAGFSRIVRAKSPGDAWGSGGAWILVRGFPSAGEGSPCAPAGGANARGLLLEVRHGRLSVWLPGDAEAGPAAWGPGAGERGRATVIVLPHHGSPRSAPEAWIRASGAETAVFQKSDCFKRENLIPSVTDFFLEKGAFTIISDGKTPSFGQRNGSGLWGILWRLPACGS